MNSYPKKLRGLAFASPICVSTSRTATLYPKAYSNVKRPHAAHPERYRPCQATCTATPTQTALVLVDHGSKRATANEMLQQVADQLRQRTTYPVFTAHMELASPSIADAMQLAKAQGAAHVIIMPFFLSPGRHVMTDIPALAAAAAAEHDVSSHQVCPPLGTHPLLIDALLDRAGLL